MQQEYKYNGKSFDVSVIACSDGDLIVTIGKFPTDFRFYIHQQDAERLVDQISEAIDEAQRLKSKEAA